MTNGEHPITPTYHLDQLEFCGLTKREYFAAMAMQGMLANTFKLGQMGNDMTAVNPEKISQQALLFTDALINELNKEK